MKAKARRKRNIKKFRNLISEFDRSVRDHENKGASPPESQMEIELQYENSYNRLLLFIQELL